MASPSLYDKNAKGYITWHIHSSMLFLDGFQKEWRWEFKDNVSNKWIQYTQLKDIINGPDYKDPLMECKMSQVIYILLFLFYFVNILFVNCSNSPLTLLINSTFYSIFYFINIVFVDCSNIN